MQKKCEKYVRNKYKWRDGERERFRENGFDRIVIIVMTDVSDIVVVKFYWNDDNNRDFFSSRNDMKLKFRFHIFLCYIRIWYETK